MNLATSKSSYVAGVALPIDGGYLARCVMVLPRPPVG
jgi:hypothetical protein